MLLPRDVFETLQIERAMFGPVPTDVELGILLNRVAWLFRDSEWGKFGVSRKTGGTTVPFPGGGTICHDVLMLPDGTAWDVLEAAGDYAKPIQSDSFVITDPGRGWLAPVEPVAVPEPTPEPTPVPKPPAPPPTPTPTPEPDAWVKLIMASIAQLSAEHTAVLAEIQAIKANGVTLETPFGTWKVNL